MGKSPADSHALETRPELPVGGPRRLLRGALAGLGAAGVLHLGFRAAGARSVAGEDFPVLCLYAIAALVGMGQPHLDPDSTPSPGLTMCGLLGLGLVTWRVALWTLPDPSACYPVAGLFWVAFPCLVLSVASLLLAGCGAASFLERGSRAAQPRSRLLHAACHLTAPACLVLTLLLALTWTEAGTVGFEHFEVALLAGLIPGLAALADA